MKSLPVIQRPMQTPETCQLLAGGAGGIEPPAWALRRYVVKSARFLWYLTLRWRAALRRRIALRTRLRALLTGSTPLAQAPLGVRPADLPVSEPQPAATAAAPGINAGDWVRVRSPEEIQRTLDASGKCGGCKFQTPMYRHCGRELRVIRRVDRFFDEARGRMVRCRNIVLLEGVYCDGSGDPDTIACDRMCFFFWRTEWLEYVARPKTTEPGDAGSPGGGPA